MVELPNVTAVYVALAFGISYAILRKFLFLPLLDILEARERDEREAQAAQAESLEALRQAVAAGEAQLSAARREALKSRESLRGEGLAALERKLAEAQERAAGEIARGIAQIKDQADRSAKEMPERARGLARELAEKILGRTVAA